MNLTMELYFSIGYRRNLVCSGQIQTSAMVRWISYHDSTGVQLFL